MSNESVTELLHQVSLGDKSAESDLIALVYDELHILASAYLRHERPGHTLQATALVHEAYIRLVGGGKSEVGSEKSEEQEPTSDLRPLTSGRWDSRSCRPGSR